MSDLRGEGSGGAMSWRSLGAITAVSSAVILYEVLITRILSVALSYHFAFLAISLAMLGLAAPGVWLSLRPLKRRTIYIALYASAIAFPGSTLAIVQLGAPLRGVLVFWVIVVLVPLLAAGTAVCALLLEAKGKSFGKMYAADLAGAAAGAFLAVPLLYGLPTPSVVAALAVLPLLAAVLLRASRVVSVIGAAALLATIAWGTPYRLRYSRYYVEEIAPLYERWTPTARITITNQIGPGFHGWGLGRNYPGGKIEQLWLDQDGSAGTPILKYTRGSPYPASLRFDVVAMPYAISSPQRVCIIGGGGGRDILKALDGGATDVEVVELNPFTVDAVSRVFAEYSGDPYHLPGVRTFVGEGRNHFASRGVEPCDVLEISQIDTFAASAAGAYALTENSLYTIEAIRTFWSRLRENGILSISRWVDGPAWPEAARLVNLEMEALRVEGIARPQEHLLVVAAANTADVMLLKRAVTPELLEQTRRVAEERGFSILWPVPVEHAKRSPVAQVLWHGTAAFEADGYDLSAPTDDRPFFFQTLHLLRGSSERAMKFGTGEREQSVVLLRRLLAILVVITVALMFLPLVARGRLPRGGEAIRSTIYFASLGLGFMFVEIPLLQRLVLYLGHPSYATTIVLGSLLVGAGVGSALAPRVPERHARTIAFATPVVVVATTMSLVGPIAAATLMESFAVRAATCAVVVFITGVSVGVMLPLGMARFDDRDRSWYWAVNGAAGVVASVLALVLALLAGFQAVLWCAALAYLIAALTIPRERR